MNFFANPIILCGSIALGIVLVLIIVVVICCKKSVENEREELKAISEEIESDSISKVETSEDKIEDVLTKMQEALDIQQENAVSFEEEQEENAIISYQELLNSLGAKKNIDVDSIEVFEDELENQVEISDINKEIIDAYQRENLDREIYRFQNDYSNDALQSEVVEDIPSSINFSNDVEFVEEAYEPEKKVVELKNNIASDKKFKRSEFISPVYGIINEEKVNKDDDAEEIIFDDSDSLLDEF